MKHFKPFLKLVIIGSLTFLLISLIVPYCLQRITESRQEALNSVAYNVEQELESAIVVLNKTESHDLWLIDNSYKLRLEPWGESKAKKPQYRFLNNEVAQNDFLKTYNAKYLRDNFIVIYEGNGRFRVTSR